MHGIRIIESTAGTRPIALTSSAVIGLVATGPAAKAELFPLNEPVLVTSVRRALADVGDTGTLPAALSAIADQGSPIIVVVRVAADVDPAAQDQAVIGGTTEDGRYTGLQALLAAEGQLGVRPRILGAPGLDSATVKAALAILAARLRGFAYAAAEGETIGAALAARADFDARELMLLWPDTSRGGGDLVARALGLRARLDEEQGWHRSISNMPLAGVTGMSRDVHFDITDASTDAGVLNAGGITTLVRQGGFRLWGTRTTATEDQRFRFEPAVRTAHALKDIIADGMAWAVDQPITRGLVRDIVETINAAFRALQAEGRIVGAKAWFDPDANPQGQLAAGRLAIDFDYTPCAPAEEITLIQRITDRYYADFGSAPA